MAPSLDRLDGKKLFLVDVGFANSDNFMAQLHGWFEEHRPTIRTEIVRWPTSTSPTPSSSGSRPTATRPSSASAPDRAARRVSGHVVDLESNYGVPTVGVHLNVFARLVRNTVKTQGCRARGGRSCRRR